jgi:parvulin-like peptidyl-prolyl isomerase
MNTADETNGRKSALRRHEGSMKNAALFLITPVFLLLSGAGIGIAQDDEPALARTSARPESGEEVLVTLRVPLDSPLFSETPVAVVNEEPITFRDLTGYIASIHVGKTEDPTPARKNYAELLERVVTTELIVQEARNIGFDETDGFKSQVEEMSTGLLISALMSRHLETVQADPAEVDDLYKKMSREFLLTTVTFEKEADAASFEEESESGEDFVELAKRFTEERRAEMESDAKEYLKLKDLLPRIAEAAYFMEVGDISQIFSTQRGFLVFRVEDARFYEDPGLKEEARQKVLEPLKKEAVSEYADSLQEKHSTIDERLLKKADFEKGESGFLSFGEEKPVDFEKLLKDERVVATVHSDPPFTITVADLARDVEQGLFHGVQKAVDRKEKLNEKKRIKLRNMLFKRNAVLEARNQGLDRTEEYAETIEGFERSLLFETFIEKVIAPDVEISEEEIRAYYEEHTDDFSSPKMFRMDGLAFRESADAESALEKLRKRADFKWVSANSPGQVEGGAEGVLDFRNALLSLTALPEDLQKDADRAKSGDVLLYSDAKGYHYVIAVEKVFPPRPEAYEAARGPIAKIIGGEKMRVLIDDWSEKLRGAYETRIFATGLDD